jgi:hypothetical protein
VATCVCSAFADYYLYLTSRGKRYQSHREPATPLSPRHFPLALVFAGGSPEELTAWVGTERGKKEPVHIATAGEDLVADLKQGLSYIRQQKQKRV